MFRPLVHSSLGFFASRVRMSRFRMSRVFRPLVHPFPWLLARLVVWAYGPAEEKDGEELGQAGSNWVPL